MSMKTLQTVIFSHKHADKEGDDHHGDEDDDHEADEEAETPTRQTSVAVLELRPHRTNMLCEPPYSAVAYMSVGCPKGRNIRIKAPSNNQVRDVQIFVVENTSQLNKNNCDCTD